MTIGKHLATFNVFREPDGLYITVADAAGVRDEISGAGAPAHLCAMNALRSALRQMDERAAQAIEAQRAGTTQIGPVADESAVVADDAPKGDA